MRNNRSKREVGLVGAGGICIDGDIALKFSRYHSASMYFAFRIIMAFMATYSTAAMAVSFTDSSTSPVVLLYNSFVAVLSLGLLFSKHKVIKICAGIVAVMYTAPLLIHIKQVAYGFFVAVNGYYSKIDLPGINSAPFRTLVLSKAEDERCLYYFLTALIFVEALGTVIACVLRIDFPMLFIFTFPIFELGLYMGFDVPTHSALMMLVAWVTLLAMNIINHTTNKAGRKNTFAVHERTKTFYFTSNECKAEFYTMYIRFVALLTAGIFLFIVLASKVSGFHRPDSFEQLRYNLHNAVEKFDIAHADDFLIDINGGSNLFGVTTVGGTNGGVLGTTNGISFNGSKALVIKTPTIDHTLYLRGYVAGEYTDNTWQPLEGDKDIYDIRDELVKKGYFIQDQNFMLLDGLDEKTDSYTSFVDIQVKGACSKFVYAPYGADYSSSASRLDNSGEMTPYNDSYVRISQTNKDYRIIYKNFRNQNWTSRVETLRRSLSEPEPDLKAVLDDYDSYVGKNYTECAELDSLDKVYDEICEKYLDGDPSGASYRDICYAIKLYFKDKGFTYDTKPGITPEGEDFIDYFLTTQKKGYCTYYATVGTQLMRKFGYPARYVEGYMVLPGQVKSSPLNDDVYEVTVKDKCAHAWTEVYIEGVGWMPAEFTPGYDNDNPNLDSNEKGQTGNNSTPDESSKANANVNSSKAEQDSSKPAESSKAQQKPANSSKPESKTDSNSKKDGSSKSDGAGHGKGDGPGGGKGAKDSDMSPVAKTVILTMAALIVGAAAIAINRRRSLDKMHDSCTQADLNKRVMAIYGYSLKYLSVLNIEVKKNISDMQMCNELLAKCHDMRIHELDDKLTELTVLAVEAHMRPDSITEEEAARAEEIMRCISDEVVAKKMDTMTMLSAKYLYCLY